MNARPGEDVAGFSTTSRSLYSGFVSASSDVGGGKLVLPEVRLVEVEAHVAEVDRRHRPASGLIGEIGPDVGERGRRVRLEDARVDRSGEEGVVDAEQHVAERLVPS